VPWTFARLSSLFRPTDADLAPETKSQIQVHRLLSLLGAALVPLFGALYDIANPEAADPWWIRLGIAGLFASLFAVSYRSKRVRRRYAVWMRGILYLMMGWFVLLATLNGFIGSYAAGLLVTYAVLIMVVGIGAQAVWPVLWFAGTGILLTAGGALLGPTPRTDPLILSAGMATVALLETIATEGQVSTSRKLREREAALRRQRNLLDQAQRLAGSWRVDLKAGTMSWSEKVHEIHEVPPGKTVGVEEGIDFYAPEARPKIREVFQRCVEEGTPYDLELPLVTAEGNRRWVRTVGASTDEEDGDVVEVAGAFQDVTERHRLQERLLEVQAEERRRITQEIHGEMGGLLASLQMAVNVARMESEAGDPEHFGRIETLVSEISTAVRTISRKLYPSDLSNYGLAKALSSLAREIEHRRGLEVHLQSELDPDERFSSLLERTAYWIVHEALVNAHRHAETDGVQVVADKTEEHLFLRVSDEGVGFDPSREKEEDQFGLEGIRRRVERLKGEIAIDTDPGLGTQISVALPFWGFSGSGQSQDRLK